MNLKIFLRGLAVSIILLQTTATQAHTGLAADHILHDATVRRCAYCALKKAAFGRSQLGEQAFWVLATPQGMDCDFWDTGQSTETGTSTGWLPDNAIALFHTHPRDAALINEHDRQTAARLEERYGQGIRFYILAGDKLGEIDPVAGTATAYGKWIGNREWIGELSRAEKRHPCS
jgi:hypothetical protein